jgi:hypothetical protein
LIAIVPRDPRGTSAALAVSRRHLGKPSLSTDCFHPAAPGSTEKTMKLDQAGFVFALALTGTLLTASGCTTDASEVDPTGGDGAGSSSEPLPTTAEGTFTLHSKFDLATNLPGRVGAVTNIIISATDDPNDPVQYIYDTVIAGLPEGTLKNALRGAGPLVTGYLNDKVNEIAPAFYPRMVSLGRRFGDISRNFGTTSRLEIVKTDAGYVARHITTGVEFKVVDGTETVDLQFPFADYGMNEIRVENIPVTLEASGKLTIEPHAIAVSFGKVLRVGIDEMLIPMIDDDAANLGDVFRHLIDCHKVGLAVYAALGVGSVGAFEGACTSGLTAGATLIYQKIAEIDANALELNLGGTAKAIDRNRDGKMDDLQRGSWSGTVKYATSPAPLGTATFSGRSN